MRTRHRSAGIAAALCAVLLSSTAFAVAASADPSPLTPTTRAERLDLLTRQAEAERDLLIRRYPTLQIPDMTPMLVIADENWPARLEECKRHFGLRPRPPGNTVSPDLNTASLPREVVNRTCQLRYPKESDLRFVLGPFELRRLWSYYVFELQSCLRGAGIDITRSPGLGEYLAERGSEDSWHPYLALADASGVRDFEYYDSICPRFPDWLRG
jgi:hypothetical protein